jgi:hypothetical protein
MDRHCSWDAKLSDRVSVLGLGSPRNEPIRASGRSNDAMLQLVMCAVCQEQYSGLIMVIAGCGVPELTDRLTNQLGLVKSILFVTGPSIHPFAQRQHVLLLVRAGQSRSSKEDPGTATVINQGCVRFLGSKV